MQPKIEIRIPANNVEERQYIIDYIFRDFLGLQIEIIVDDLTQDYVITFLDKELLIRDFFFSKYPKPLSYLLKDNFPSVSWTKNRFIIEENIPVLYGVDELNVTDNRIVCGIDIFASSFFMFTRWEEYINCTRDNHERFPGVESIAYKNNFLHRPIVNEYVEMLWNMLFFLGFCGERKVRRYELVLTHDVDHLQYPKKKHCRALLGDIVKRRDLKMAQKRAKYLFFEDPFDKYDWLMTQSEIKGVKSHFYFMASTLVSPLSDTTYYINKNEFKKIISDIVNREHVVGFHPGYYSYINADVWRKEKTSLEKMINQSISEGRQHYLRVKMPDTLNIWEENKMLVDSSLGYADREGFRCGTGDEFPVYDFLNRKQMRLHECPLIVMEGTLWGARNYSLEQSLIVYRDYIEISKKYNSKLTFLFHNSSFEDINWSGWERLYMDMLTN